MELTQMAACTLQGHGTTRRGFKLLVLGVHKRDSFYQVHALLIVTPRYVRVTDGGW